MFPAVLHVAEHIAQLKRRARNAGVPAIYVNDNFGKWQHDLPTLIESCFDEDCRDDLSPKRSSPTKKTISC